MEAFDRVWGRIVHYAETHRAVRGLGREPETGIEYVAGEEQIIVDTDEPAVIDREELRAAWETLRTTGELSSGNVPQPLGPHRTAVALALLVRAAELPYDTGPVTVYAPDED